MHAAQVEKGTKIWNELFVPNLKGKSIKKTFSPVYFAPDLSFLLCGKNTYLSLFAFFDQNYSEGVVCSDDFFDIIYVQYLGCI